MLEPAHAGYDAVHRRARTRPADVMACACDTCTATGQGGAQQHAEPAKGQRQQQLNITAWQPLAPRTVHPDAAAGTAYDVAARRRMSVHQAQDLSALRPQASVAYFKPPAAKEERGRRASVKAIHQDLLAVASSDAARNRYPAARVPTAASRPLVSASDAVNAPSALGGIVISRTKIVRRIAEWTTEYLESLTVNPECPAPTASHPARNETVEDITTVLTTLPVPATVYLLAIHFVERFMGAIARAADTGNPAGKNFVAVLCKPGARGPTLRLFIAGIMLADAALDDNSFGFQTWRAVSGLSNAVLRQLEMKALALLEFRITVPADAWIKYVERLRKYNYGLLALQKDVPDMPSSIIMARVLNGVLFATRAGLAHGTVVPLDAANITQPISQKLFEPVTPTSPAMSVVSPMADRTSLVTMMSPMSAVSAAAAPPLVPATSVRRTLMSPPAPRVEGAGKRKLPLPVPWSPGADPVVPKARRTSVSNAIGSERARAYAEQQVALRRSASAKHAHSVSLSSFGFQPLLIDVMQRVAGADVETRSGVPTLVKKLLRASAAH